MQRHWRGTGIFAKQSRNSRSSQPAPTGSIVSLEAILGGQLFDRLSTGVEPPGAGMVFLDNAGQ
jgi:DNA-binding transcriptional LysR family regulator